MTYLIIDNLVVASILLLGFLQIGSISIIFYENIFNRKWPIQFTGQNLLLGYAIAILIIGWLSLIIPADISYRGLAILLILLGLFFMLTHIPRLYHEVLNLNRLYKSFTSPSIPSILFILVVALYFIANYGPVTNADSLDYHLGYAFNFLRQPFESLPDWYNGRMAQSGEKLISIGLSLQVQSIANLIQFSSLLVVYKILEKIFNENLSITQAQKSYLLLAFISSPIFLFLGISAKPQLMPVALTSLAFALVMNEVKDGHQSSRTQLLISLSLAVFFTNIAMSEKFSFYISGAILYLLCICIAFRKKLLIQFAFIAGFIFLLTMGPVFLDKYLRYHGSIIDIIFNPVAGSSDSLRLFMQWLKAYRENNFYFPFYLIFPSKLGNFSTVLGIGSIIMVYIITLYKRIPRFIFLSYCALIILLLCLGQPSSRFYLEPYVWALLLFAYYGNSIKSRIAQLSFAVCIAFQSTLVIASLTSYDYNLLTALFSKNISAFEKKYAYGSDMVSWLDQAVPDKSPILFDHRSHAFTSRILISTFPIEFFGMDQVDIDLLRLNLIRLNVNKVLTYSDSPNFEMIRTCSEEKFAGPNDFTVSTRNPFNAGLVYQAYIYKIEPNKLIDCVIKKNKT